MMEPIERDSIAKFKATAIARIQVTARGSWEARRAAASDLLAAAYDVWWGRHVADGSAYDRDLARLNALAGWRGEYAQVSRWRSHSGAAVLMPPKFFGGAPLALDESFVASMSLNHAILPARSAPFAQELTEQQRSLDAFVAHSEYFRRPYAYSRFFKPRGEILHAYATKIGALALPVVSDWPTLNHRFSFYIEAFPTRSYKFAMPPAAATRARFENDVFVCAINSIVQDVVLRLLRPTCVLLAGKATWNEWPDPAVAGFGNDVSKLLRADGSCRAYRASAFSAIHGGPTTSVRTNFVRTVYGPNSTPELRRLGQDILAVPSMNQAAGIHSDRSK